MRHSISVDIDVADLDITPEDVRDMATSLGMDIGPSLPDCLAFIESRVWSADDWAQLQDSIARCFVIGQRRAA